MFKVFKNRTNNSLIVLFLISAIGAAFMHYNFKNETPKIILDSLEDFKKNRSYMDSIGGFEMWEYSYSNFFVDKGDSLVCNLKIFRKSGILEYQVSQILNQTGEKNIVHEELTFH